MKPTIEQIDKRIEQQEGNFRTTGADYDLIPLLALHVLKRLMEDKPPEPPTMYSGNEYTAWKSGQKAMRELLLKEIE